MTRITPLISIRAAYSETNADILKNIQELSESQISWRPNPACHSMAFILWHLARWTDHLQATIPGMTEELERRLPPGEQLWDQGQYAARWGFNVSQLGYAETGTETDLESAEEPHWPEKETLLDYARQAFAAAERAIEAIDEEQFEAVERQQYTDEYIEASRAKTGTVGNAIVEHLVHNVQHLGELYYLRGLLNYAESHPSAGPVDTAT